MSKECAVQRRYFLAGAAALGAGLEGSAVAPAFAQGKAVFLNYTQEQLDQAYDQSVWAPQFAELQTRDDTMSAAVRQAMPPRTERYGKSDAELVDIFTPSIASGAPVLVYFHGGEWQYNSRLTASFVAPTVVGRGAAYVAAGFNNIRQARLPDMIEQCRSAVEWAVRNAAGYGGDPNRVYIGGHSSGGHLASCVLITDWAGRGLPADTIKGAFLMSGMYDLYPVMLSSRGKYVGLTAEEQAAASAMRHLDRVTCPVAIAWADLDSPEFKRQSQVFAQALQGMGRLASRTVVFAANHFQEPQHLAKPDSELSGALLKLMGI
jgi:arylformamidase